MTNKEMSKDLTIITYSDQQIKDIKSQFAVGATDQEFRLFMYTAEKYNLDIFTKEIYLIKNAKKPEKKAQIFTSKDGFVMLAHRSGMFNGLETGTTGTIEGNDLVGWCKVYNKEMQHPITVQVHLSEYNTHFSLWASKPITMILKVATVQALRLAFNINGLFTPEECGVEIETPAADPIKKDIKKDPEVKKDLLIDEDQKKKLWNMAKTKNKMSLQDLQDFSYKHIKVKDLSKLTAIEGIELYKQLQGLKKFDDQEQTRIEVLNKFS
jgi:phage recombination protein Bet